MKSMIDHRDRSFTTAAVIKNEIINIISYKTQMNNHLISPNLSLRLINGKTLKSHNAKSHKANHPSHQFSYQNCQR